MIPLKGSPYWNHSYDGLPRGEMRVLQLRHIAGELLNCILDSCEARLG
jgi:hypothetical protein